MMFGIPIEKIMASVNMMMLSSSVDAPITMQKQKKIL